MLANMYRPRGWHTLAEQIAAGIRGNGAPIADAVLATVELNTTKKAQTAFAVEAVRCVDGPSLANVDPLKIIDAMIEENVLTYERVSTHFAGSKVKSQKTDARRLFNYTSSRCRCATIGNQGGQNVLLDRSTIPRLPTKF